MTQQKLLTLEEWAAESGRFGAHPPSLHTLRVMVRNGMFDPPAIKVGKAYYVEAGARVIDPNRRPTLVDRLKAHA